MTKFTETEKVHIAFSRIMQLRAHNESTRMHINAQHSLQAHDVFGICGNYVAIKSSTIKQSMADRLSSLENKLGLLKRPL